LVSGKTLQKSVKLLKKGFLAVFSTDRAGIGLQRFEKKNSKSVEKFWHFGIKSPVSHVSRGLQRFSLISL
jgi:hypothetical protein